MIAPPDRPAVLSLPRLVPVAPEITWISRSRNWAGETTAIARLWTDPTAPCLLCPAAECNREAGVCLVTVQARVPDELAPLFSRTASDDAGPLDDPARRGRHEAV